MTNTNYSISKTLPVLFAFFIMGIVDFVGTATNYLKNDFALTDTMANTLPMVVFLWFFVFSIPVGLLMNTIGRKKTVMLSMIVHFVALTIPLVSYNFTSMLISFALLGIANTIIQVSLNPLLSNVVTANKLTGSLSAGQFIKAICSFIGPLLAAYFATNFIHESSNSWTLVFGVYIMVTIISSIWLLCTNIVEDQVVDSSASFLKSISLLKDSHLLLLFIGIMTIVGIDVGINVTAPKLMIERIGLDANDAVFVISIYFICRTVGAFMGSFILSVLPIRKFYIVNAVLGLAALVGLMYADDKYLLYVLIGAIGFLASNIFSIIFASGLKYAPNSANDVSGLMIMGLVGGALFSWLMGLASDGMGAQLGAVLVLVACGVYQVYLSLVIK